MSASNPDRKTVQGARGLSYGDRTPADANCQLDGTAGGERPSQPGPATEGRPRGCAPLLETVLTEERLREQAQSSCLHELEQLHGTLQQMYLNALRAGTAGRPPRHHLSGLNPHDSARAAGLLQHQRADPFTAYQLYVRLRDNEVYSDAHPGDTADGRLILLPRPPGLERGSLLSGWLTRARPPSVDVVKCLAEYGAWRHHPLRGVEPNTEEPGWNFNGWEAYNVLSQHFDVLQPVHADAACGFIALATVAGARRTQRLFDLYARAGLFPGLTQHSGLRVGEMAALVEATGLTVNVATVSFVSRPMDVDDNGDEWHTIIHPILAGGAGPWILYVPASENAHHPHWVACAAKFTPPDLTRAAEANREARPTRFVLARVPDGHQVRFTHLVDEIGTCSTEWIDRCVRNAGTRNEPRFEWYQAPAAAMVDEIRARQAELERSSERLCTAHQDGARVLWDTFMLQLTALRRRMDAEGRQWQPAQLAHEVALRREVERVIMQPGGHAIAEHQVIMQLAEVELEEIMLRAPLEGEFQRLILDARAEFVDQVREMAMGVPYGLQWLGHAGEAPRLPDLLELDDALPAYCWFVGPNPPPKMLGWARGHWCTAASAIGCDTGLCELLRQQGYTICHCGPGTWPYDQGRCVHFYAAQRESKEDGLPPPEIVHTSFTSVALPHHYLVPVARHGWAPFISHADGEVLFGLRYEPGVDEGAAGSAGFSVVGCKGPLPYASMMHRRIGIVRHLDPIGGQHVFNRATVKSAYFRYEPRYDHAHRTAMISVETRTAAAVMTACIAMAALFSVPQHETCDLRHWARTAWIATAALLLYLVRGPLVAHVPMLRSFSAAAPCALAWLIMSMAYGTCEGVWLRLLLAGIGWYACMIICIAVASTVAFDWVMHRVDCRTMRSCPWQRHSYRTMVPLITRVMPIPMMGKALLKTASRYDGKATSMVPVLRSSVISVLNQIDWEPGDNRGERMVSDEVLQALAIALSSMEPADLPAFTRAMDRSTRRCAKACKRPGCEATRPIGRYRWKHGLCPACYASLSAPPTGSARLWADGVSVDGPLGGFACIPERELPLPAGDVDLEPTCRLTVPTDVLGSVPPFVAATRPDAEQEVVHRPAGFLAGFGLSGCAPLVTLKSQMATVRAIICRVMKRHHMTVQPGIWERAERFERLIEAMTAREQYTPLTVEEWVSHFPPARQKVLREAFESWAAAGYSIDLTRAMFTLFVKREFLPLCKPIGGSATVMVPITSYKPRAIQAPPDTTHVVAGPILRVLTSALKDAWGPRDPIFYASVEPGVLDGWLNDVSGAECFIWSDYKMFDCTHSRASWRFVRRVYERIIRPDWPHLDEFKRVLDFWECPSGNGAGAKAKSAMRVRYKGRVMNASGRDDTALANALLNGVAMTIALAAVYWGKQPMDLADSELATWLEVSRLAIVGDDCLAAVPAACRNGAAWAACDVAAATAKFGFKAEVGISHRLVDAVFLGCRPYRVGGRWLWGPTLGRRLYKHHCCIHPHHDPIAWLRGVARDERDHLGFVPVLGAMARRVMEITSGPITSQRKDPYAIDWTTRRGVPNRPDLETYQQCAEAYTKGQNVVTVADLLEIEEQISSVSELPWVLSHPALTQVLLQDDL